MISERGAMSNSPGDKSDAVAETSPVSDREDTPPPLPKKKSGDIWENL